jgi:hypothetical protein
MEISWPQTAHVENGEKIGSDRKRDIDEAVYWDDEQTEQLDLGVEPWSHLVMKLSHRS